MGRILLPVTLVLALIFAGCAADSGRDANKKNLGGTAAPAPTGPAPIASVAPLGEQVLVSPTGHRIAEFMVARNRVDPNNLIIAAHDYDNLGTGTMSCVIYVSKDGGAKWAQSKPIPVLNRPHLQFDGWVSFDAKGVAHYVCLDYSSGASTIPFYSSSTDGGETWSPAVVVQPMAGGCDKTSLHAALDGRVYIACGGRIARTDDAGKTWIAAVNSDGSNPNGFVEGAFGEVYLMTRSGVTKSTDRGETWKRTAVGPFQSAPGYNDQNRWVRQEPWTTLPTIAIHPKNDHIFVAQQSWDTATSLFKTTVYLGLEDGVNFTAVASPNFKSTTCTPCHVTKPSIAVDAEGRLGLLVQLVNDGGHIKEVMFSASSDEGQTWVEPIVLSKTAPPNEWASAKAFAPDPRGAAALAQYLAANPSDAGQVAIGVGLTSAVSELQMRWNGEYWGIISSPSGFVAAWIDHSNGGTPQLYTRIIVAE